MPHFRERAGLALGLCLSLLAAGCGSNHPGTGAGRPTPTPVGQPTGNRRSLVIDATGGTVTSTDGGLTLTVPAGALAGPVAVTVDVITNTAPGGVGSAYRLGPAGTVFSAPFTLTFKPPLTTYTLSQLVVETQEGQGFWIRPGNVVSNATAGTLTATATAFGDWAVATGSTVNDLVGTFNISSTIDTTYSVTGQATLNFAGQDPTALYYLQWGTITLKSVSVPGFTCTIDAPSMPLLTNVADLTPNPNPTTFEWGVSGHWNLTCTGAGGAQSSQTQLFAFDTQGVGSTTTVGCTRTFSGTPVVGTGQVAATMIVDCGARGSMTASWNFQTCVAGTACTPANTCHTGAISCSTGAPVCADSGTSLANGTTCGLDQVCLSGACHACVSNVACAPTNLCHTGTTSCSTGTSVCVDSGLNQPDGTSCGTNQVCSGGSCVACTAGLSCVPSTNLCHQGTTSCSTGTSVCTDLGTNQPDTTSCGTAMTCTAGLCGCTAGGVCTVASDLCHVAAYACPTGSTGAPVCTATTANVTDGTVCGTNLVCSGGTCTACTVGADCIPTTDACHVGAQACSTGPACNATTTARADGFSCGPNQVCSAGTCTACTVGGDCPVPSDPCHVGSQACAAGPVCSATTTNRTDGTTCGTNQVCSAGTCTACTVGGDCAIPNDPCHVGSQACAAGPVCSATATNRPDGTICGTNQVCSAGACVACTAGGSCTPPANPCHTGTISCSTGAAVCVDTGNVADGTSCGANMACAAGACTCVAGATCTASADPCHTAQFACVANAPTCTVNTPVTNVADGTTCGTNQVCSGGACTACTPNGPCTPANPCHVGSESCTAGPVCTDTGTNVTDGTSCGTALACTGGTCTCVSGGACTVATDPCHTAHYACVNNVPSCTSDVPIADVLDGTTCGAGLFCSTGSCISCAGQPVGTVCSSTGQTCDVNGNCI